ncbi:hypothetical protein CKAN_01119500 [Cinnamomum micranthum f. kanehirae]|uniref:Uncharacterized protein n=1 Tax=Cinnamomum micranthum f. kanehirae TaxID=337451 RepID=A0A443NVC5_9MAGN|nr:hypothetical protein CKAN_01119500 [Cinnamomum micranthum f. kanehirae]
MTFGFNMITQKTLTWSSSVELVRCDGRRERVMGSVMLKGKGRRSLLSSVLLLVSTTATASAPAPALEPESKKSLIQKYLKKSEENKAKNDKEIQIRSLQVKTQGSGLAYILCV